MQNPEYRLTPRSRQDRSVKTRIHALTTDKGCKTCRRYSLLSRYNQKKRELTLGNMKENLALGLFSDGTASTGAATTKQITGLRAVLSESSTYGGIAVNISSPAGEESLAA